MNGDTGENPNGMIILLFFVDCAEESRFFCSQRVVDLAHLVASKWPGAPVQGSGDPLEDFCQTNPETKECKVYEA